MATSGSRLAMVRVKYEKKALLNYYPACFCAMEI